MAVQQKEDRGPEGEACGGGESGQLREGAGGRPEGEAGGQDPPGGQGVQGRDEAPRRLLTYIAKIKYPRRN